MSSAAIATATDVEVTMDKYGLRNIQMPSGNKQVTIETLLKLLPTMDGEPFYIMDLGNIAKQFRKWRDLMPRVVPFYAVKCNSDPKILDTMVSLGASFDCASAAEIKEMTSRGVPPSRIIYAHPCKPVKHLHYAKSVGVDLMTFDNEDELRKIKEQYPEARLVLRVLADDSYSACRLGTKFGAAPGLTFNLLQRAKELELNVVGVSFHVGSGCTRATPFADAVHRARKVFDQATELGFKMTLLDVGGGFPGNDTGAVSFPSIAKELTAAIDECFPPSCGVTIIGEPGRYMVSAAGTLAINITSKRVVQQDLKTMPPSPPKSPTDSREPSPVLGGQKMMYYVNDGVYGAFNCTLFDHYTPTPQVLVSQRKETGLLETTLWGPTCDSMDCIGKEFLLPELDMGDWLVFEDMGAYTFVCSTTFNGFPRAIPFYASPV